jgi:hypothetical protein
VTKASRAAVKEFNRKLPRQTDNPNTPKNDPFNKKIIELFSKDTDIF